MTSLYGYYEVFDDSYIRERLAKQPSTPSIVGNDDAVPPEWAAFAKAWPQQTFLLQWSNFWSFLTTDVRRPHTICLPRVVHNDRPLDYARLRRTLEHFTFPCHVPALQANARFALFNSHHRQVNVGVTPQEQIVVGGLTVRQAHRVGPRVVVWIVEAGYEEMAEIAARWDVRTTG